MGAVVTAQFRIGAGAISNRNQLNQILQILNIQDPSGKLPVSANCRYVLSLELRKRTPTDCTPDRPPTKKGGRKQKRDSADF
jgi:hypothetical protein